MLPYESVLYCSLFLFLVGGVYFLTMNDEVPLVLVILYLVSGLYRYYVVGINPNNLKVGWVVVAYSRSIFSLTNDLALLALNYFLMGTAIFMFSYILFNAMMGSISRTKTDQETMLKSYVLRKRTFVITLFILFTIINFYSRIVLFSITIDVGITDMSSGVSYFIFLPFALGGLILIMYMIYKNVDGLRDPGSKAIFLGLIIVSAISSYNPGARFNFLSWAIALGVMFVGPKTVAYKLRVYSIGLSILLMIYSLAGLARTPGAFLLSFEDQVDMAIGRLETAEDQNLLDGFMMALQVYPDQLEYQHGFQHLEILLRPIPRTIWPDKPLGGYANKLGLNDKTQMGTVGISESIYGSFYGEGGVGGIILCCIIYGCFFAYLNQRAKRYQSDMRYLLKGITIASIIALIRGGDLAGIVAFIGMSYWPVFLFTFQYGSFVRRFNLWYRSYEQSKRIMNAPPQKVSTLSIADPSVLNN
jgi:hypothetical protein